MSFVKDAFANGKKAIRRRFFAPAADAFWGIYGRRLRNPNVWRRPASCLFLCKGNICRSPFAERIARKIAGERSLGEISFVSAGFDVTLSLPPPVQAVQAAQRFGVALDDHRSARLTEEMIARADMIFVMETAQLIHLRGAYPSIKGNFFLLPLFRDGLEVEEGNYHRYNISDPYGGELDLFMSCYGRIGRCVERLIAGIAKGSGRE